MIFSERELTFTFVICYRRSVCLSVVCLSVTLVRPTQPVEIVGNFSSPFGTLAIQWHPRKILPIRRGGGVKRKRDSEIGYLTVHKRIASDVPIYLKFVLKVTHPFRKCRFRQFSLNGASAVRASKKRSIITNRKSTARFPSSHRWTLCVNPKSPKGWLKTRIFLHLALPFISFLQAIVNISNLVCGLNIAIPSLQMANRPRNGRGHVTWPVLNF